MTLRKLSIWITFPVFGLLRLLTGQPQRTAIRGAGEESGSQAVRAGERNR